MTPPEKFSVIFFFEWYFNNDKIKNAGEIWMAKDTGVARFGDFQPWYILIMVP